MSEPRPSRVLLVVAAIALLTGGVLGFGAGQLEELPTSDDISAEDEPVMYDKPVTEPVTDPSLFNHPVAMLALVTVGSLVPFLAHVRKHGVFNR